MKLRQFHNYTVIVSEITPTSLRICRQKILRKETEEYLFENILIKDIYEIKHHDRYAYGYVFLFGAILGEFGLVALLNPGTEKTGIIIFSVLTVLSIVRVFLTRTKIYIPTKDQGLIKFYKMKPSKRKVREFLFELEGKALLVAKSHQIK